MLSSTYGSFGASLLGAAAVRSPTPLICCRRPPLGGACPCSLRTEMAVAFAVRRGLAQRLSDRWRPGEGLEGAEEPVDDADAEAGDGEAGARAGAAA